MKKRIALLVLSSMTLTVAAEAQEHIFRHRIAGYLMPDQAGSTEPPGTGEPNEPPEEPTENLPPVITGVPSGLTAPSGGSINLFPAITVSDPNVSQVLNAIIMLENPERGDLGNLGGFMGGGETYMMSGTAAQITAALRGMTLHPPAGGPIPGDDAFAYPITQASRGSSVLQVGEEARPQANSLTR